MTDGANPAGVTAGVTQQGQQVAAHWAKLSVTYDGAVKALKEKGVNPEQATADDLHAVDMIHMGGLAATDTLAELARVRAGHHVLDVGAGVGGPARRIARKYGAHVKGVELSEPMRQTAAALTALVRLQDQVKFMHGSALMLPFEDGAFDVLVMQHVAMQIAEKDQLFGECARVLRPGGVLALHEIFEGDGGAPQFPLAWATDPAMSSLEQLDACTSRLAKLGLTAGPFVDQSEAGRQYHAASIETRRKALAQQQGAEGLSVEATDTRLKTSISMERNLRERRLLVGMMVCHKKP